MPHDSRPWKNGNLTEFNPAEAHAWIVAHEVDKALGVSSKVVKFSDQRDRLAAAQAEKAELQVQVMRGDLVPVEAVERGWSQVFSTIRDLLRSIPMSCVDRVMAAAEDGRPAVKAALQEEIDEALIRASKIDVVIEAADDEAAA